MQVTVNQCRSLLRSHWWSRTEPMPDTIPDKAAESDGVREAVMALDPKYRVVIYLYYYEQYTVKEIAKLLHISTSNVSTRLFRAREILKKRLEE
ncbi:MAG: sigma-70 family RNA polymerase sigma factor [Alistipes sp.]|nr:sigma-70 family RNA polymerase sigma factor [Alistipes sp.]